ncbi:MAG: signal peptidase II [Nanoarchaeota archaeon]
MKKKYFYIIPILIILDIITKLYFKNKNINFLKYLNFNYTENTGAIFGILKNNNLFFIILTIIIVILLVYLIKKEKKYQLELSIILSGAIGNLIDRIIYGYVIDFIDTKIWPIFNLADMYITIGIALILLKIITEEKSKKDLNNKEKPKKHGRQ